MYFRILHDETTGAVSYLLADLQAAEAVLVDPQAADVPVLAAMLAEHRLQLRWVLRTHEHDRVRPGEAQALAALQAPQVQHRPPGAMPVLVFGHEHLQVLPTPGHTAQCLSFGWRDRVFCGGLFTVDDCPYQPRPALPDALWRSATQTVFALPAETLVFCGHARSGRAVSTVHELRRWHPWLGGTSRDEFLARVGSPPLAGTGRAPMHAPAQAAPPFAVHP
jgi:glyoxylase-like metal-dependent hydrolase (beta-lactamase superfamily II)